MTADSPERAVYLTSDGAADRANSTPDAASYCEHEWVAAEFRRQTNSGPFADADRLVLETVLCVGCGETKAVEMDGDAA